MLINALTFCVFQCGDIRRIIIKKLISARLMNDDIVSKYEFRHIRLTLDPRKQFEVSSRNFPFEKCENSLNCS